VIYFHRKASIKRLRYTIAHEMIHQFQDLAGYWQGLSKTEEDISGDALFWHGQEFCYIADLMKKDGLKI